MLLHSPVYIQDGKLEIAEYLLMVISTTLQWGCGLPFSLLGRPILSLWMDASMQPGGGWIDVTMNCWRSVDAHLWAYPRDLLTVIGCLTIITKYAYSLYWQPVYSAYVISFESKILGNVRLLSHHDKRHLHDWWCMSVAFQHFRSANDGKALHVLVLDIYSLSSSSFLIQLILLQFHDVT
jgi:hypothetical protein